MTNSSLRERFNIPEKNYSTVSRIISDSISEGLVSAYDEASKSRKFAGYIPFWV
jgi:predicted HTH transcriptional regulator